MQQSLPRATAQRPTHQAMDFTQAVGLLGMREQDAVDALGKNLAQAMAITATPTTQLDLERN
jgi:hypothetical protein